MSKPYEDYFGFISSRCGISTYLGMNNRDLIIPPLLYVWTFGVWTIEGEIT